MVPATARAGAFSADGRGRDGNDGLAMINVVRVSPSFAPDGAAKTGDPLSPTAVLTAELRPERVHYLLRVAADGGHDGQEFQKVNAPPAFALGPELSGLMKGLQR